MYILDDVHFTAIQPSADAGCDGLPYTTHEGVLDVLGHRFRCYRLSNGQAVVHKDDIDALVSALMETA